MFSKVGLINVPIKVGQEAWKKCFALSTQHSFIFGINEAFAASKNTYRHMMKAHKYRQFGLKAGPNPIFWHPELYKALEKRHVRLHPKGSGVLAKRFPGFNSARYATGVLFEKTTDEHRFGVINTHWVPNGKKVPNNWRIRMRKKSKRGVKALAKNWLNQGYPVWFIGDTNIKKPFRMRIKGAKFHWIKGQGIDKIGIWIPNKKNKNPMRFLEALWARFLAPTDHKYGYSATAFYE